MNRKLFRALAAGVVLTTGLVLGGTLYAQQRDEAPMSGMSGMSGMMGMMAMMKDCPMHAAMAERPAKVLEHRDELNLSGEQIARLEALNARAMAAHGPAMERMAALHTEIAAVTSDVNFDEGAVRAALGRMGDLHTEMALAMMRTRHDVRSVLTAEQREKLAELGGGMMGMHEMMGMMGGMDMEDCPMMRGMMDEMGGMQMRGDTAGALRHQPN